MNTQINVNLIRCTVPAEGLKDYSLITFEIVVPYFIWTELLTHKRFARNASSNRAMGVSRNIDELGYYEPIQFYLKGTGMQAGEGIELFSELDAYCVNVWKNVWDYCVNAAKNLEENGIAKEQASRVLPTFKMMKGIVTGTYDAWKNFLVLRNNPNADTAMQLLAGWIKFWMDIIDVGKDIAIHHALIHVPYGEDLDYTNRDSLFILAGRLARISYGEVKTKDSDLALGKRLLKDSHMSPFEHIAHWNTSWARSAVCSKDEDIYFANGLEYGWLNARAAIEEYGLYLFTGDYYEL